MAVRVTALIALLLPSPALASSPAPEATEPSVLVRLVLEDGAWVDGEGPVERRDGLVLFRLAGGRVASIPEGRLAEVRPRPEAPAQEPAVRAPAPDVRPVDEGSGPAPAPARGGVIRNGDLPPPLETSPPLAAGHEEYLASLAPLTYDGLTDVEGRDEAWWRDRVADYENDLAFARAEVDEAYDVLRDWEQLYLELVPGGGNLESIGRRITRARRDLEAARRHLDSLVAEWDALREEARVSGALPGWLR